MTEASLAADTIRLTPAETLVFALETNTSPRVTLLVENTSSRRVIFKVKTTQPSWYYVRPNQSVLDVGESEEVSVVLLDTECNRFVQEAAADRAERTDRHRFLVQAKCISDDQFRALSALKTTEERSSEFNRLWEDSPANDRKMKLKVEFTYPSPDRLSTPAARGASLEQTQTSGSGGGDNVLNELQTLRKKYDAVVEYTVHVTAERDTVVAELEELKKEGARDPKKKGGSSPRQGAADSAADRRVMQGFSWLSLLLVALVCFAAGRYMGDHFAFV